MSQDILVLAVDDDPAFTDLVADVLERISQEIVVRIETDPTAALERVGQEPFDCLVCDYHMPEMDGLQLCERIRHENPDLPFFLLTTDESTRAIEQGLANGATDIIHKKPGIKHFKLLANRIENAVQHHRTRSRLCEMSPQA